MALQRDVLIKLLSAGGVIVNCSRSLAGGQVATVGDFLRLSRTSVARWIHCRSSSFAQNYCRSQGRPADSRDCRGSRRESPDGRSITFPPGHTWKQPLQARHFAHTALTRVLHSRIHSLPAERSARPNGRVSTAGAQIIRSGAASCTWPSTSTPYHGTGLLGPDLDRSNHAGSLGHLLGAKHHPALGEVA
jgi:hypothetical protein